MFLVLLAALESEEERRTISDLYESHKGRLRKVALSETDNLASAEDAVEEAFIAVIENKEKVLAMDEESFLRWSYVVVVNKCRDARRRNRNLTEMPDGFEETLADDGTSVEDRVIQLDMYEKLVTHVADLGADTQSILRMKYVLHLKAEVIANKLGFSINHVNNTLARSKARLRKLLESEMYDNAKV